MSDILKKVTEQDSFYADLDKMPVGEVLYNINKEDKKVALAVENAIPVIEAFVKQLVPRVKSGGRLFYIGAGTSGRLGVLDASEIPPTFGMPEGVVIGVIAGGDTALRHAVENAEDHKDMGWQDLMQHDINEKDSLVGITASGTAPYVLGAVEEARKRGLLTAGISCNPESELSKIVEYGIEAVVGPEFVTGSTRMKSGTAQKLILNMISTSLMLQLGRVKGNKMVDMQLTNKKLVDRGTRMIIEELNIDYEAAKRLLLVNGSVRLAIEAYHRQK